MKIITLKENRDFQRIYRRGKSYASPVLVTYITKNRENNLQIGITTGKKIGCAVNRSRCRRIIRAAYTQIQPQLKTGYNIVFVARSKTPHVKSTDVLQAMRQHFKQANILN